jgi:D-cysteine desulfhydrase
MPPLSPSDLDAIPRLGWVDGPSPITPLPRAAEALGLEFLGVKRDDLGLPFHGGSKPRKLDYLLAVPPFADAPAWAAAGGVGSGMLVTLTEVARTLGRRIEAHMFWTPLTRSVVGNLAFTASGPARIHFYGSRTAMALRQPSVFLGSRANGVPVIAPGATSPRGMIGSVRAGLELAAQVRAGEIPEPERVYVALGSGGTAVGLAVGFALAGLSTTVAAIAVVERFLSPQLRVRSLERAVLAELARFGLKAPAAPLALALDHAHAGDGYALVTAEGLAAVAAMADEGITIEPVYTGKAMAALRADARRLGLKRVLFWSTVHRALPEPDPAYREELPPALRRRLVATPLQDEGAPPRRRRVTRRRVLAAIGAAAAVTIAIRVTGYPPLPGFPGEVLAMWEAHVIHAAGEALLAPHATAAEIDQLAARVDRYLGGMPKGVQREAHAMLALIEHGTTPLARRLSRFTRIDAAAREAFLRGLDARGGIYAEAYRGLRDLVMLAYYQQPSTWAALGYEGPRLPLTYDPRGPDRWAWAAYDALVAPEGAVPKAAR